MQLSQVKAVMDYCKQYKVRRVAIVMSSGEEYMKNVSELYTKDSLNLLCHYYVANEVWNEFHLHVFDINHIISIKMFS